jgi:hypothetical protein
MKYILIGLILFALPISSCKTKEKMSVIAATDKLEDENIRRSTAPVIIYKTYKDFSDFVPVIMNAEKTKIVSYPAPTDLFPGSKPAALNLGYLLDRKGINENVVFLNITYDAYSKLVKVPSLDEMNALIMEKYPLVELYYCGNKTNYKDLIPELNILIDNGFPDCIKADIIPMTMELQVQ